MSYNLKTCSLGKLMNLQISAKNTTIAKRGIKIPGSSILGMLQSMSLSRTDLGLL